MTVVEQAGPRRTRQRSRTELYEHCRAGGARSRDAGPADRRPSSPGRRSSSATRIAVASSYGGRRAAAPPREGMPGVDVLFLETGYHFPETIGTRDALAACSTSPSSTSARADGRRAGRRVRQGPVRPGSEPVLPDAQGRAARGGARGLRGVGHRRPPGDARPAPARSSSSGTPRTAWSRSTRSRPGPSTSSSTTPPSAASRSTRCSPTATPRSAACPAPAGRARRGPPRRPLGRPAKNECGMHR